MRRIATAGVGNGRRARRWPLRRRCATGGGACGVARSGGTAPRAPERSSGRNVATTGRDASAEVVAAAAAAAAAAAVAAAAAKATARAVRAGTTPALQPAAAAAPAPAPPPAAPPPPPPRSLVLDANPESAAEVADAATAASDCPACAGRHRPHTCDRRKGRKERKRDALSPVRPERCAPASVSPRD